MKGCLVLIVLIIVVGLLITPLSGMHSHFAVHWQRTHPQEYARQLNEQRASEKAAADAAKADDQPSYPWPPLTGHQYVTGGGIENLHCYESDTQLDQVSDAASKNDAEGVEQLSSDAPVIAAGTTIRVLGYHIFHGYVDTRLRSGDYSGRECWFLVGNSDLVDGHPFLKSEVADDQ